MLRVVGGTYKRRKLNQPNLDITRPTKDIAKEGLFSSLGDISNKSFLDCFGGSGAMGIEAYSRGANDVVIVEKNREPIKVIKENLASLDIKDIKVLMGDFYEVIKKINKTFDIVFVDPPYKFIIDDKFINNLFEYNVINNSSVLVIERDELLKDVNLDNFNVKQLKYGKTYIYILRGK